MSQWQPIETAPKEEWSHIIAFAGGRVGEMVLMDHDDNLVWCWVSADWNDEVDQPTHWLPLPEAPK